MFIPPSDDDLTIRTERLLLRPARGDDASILFEHCSDPRLPRLMTWAPHRDAGETKDFLTRCVDARKRGSGYAWCVFEDGKFRAFVGMEGVVREVLAVRVDRAELGYWCALAHHGRGIMTEAAGAATAFSFRRLGLHKVVVRAMAENAASLRVIEKLGFTRVGVARRDCLRDGVWHDHAAFEMLEDDPAALRLQSRFPAAR